MNSLARTPKNSKVCHEDALEPLKTDFLYKLKIFDKGNGNVGAIS